MAHGDRPALERILRQPRMREAFRLLTEDLPSSDLTSLLLEVFRARAERVTPAELMLRHDRDRFVSPIPVPFAGLRAVEEAFLRALPESFDPIALAPLVPLGTHSAMARVDQNNVVSTIRSTEVAADPTSGLALVAAARRKGSLFADPRSAERVRLAAFQRVARAQRFESSGLSFPHFELSGMVTAGRDVGNLTFERESAEEHLHVMADALLALGASHVRLELTDFADGSFAAVIDSLRAVLAGDRVEVIDRPDRPSGRGYYEGFCFKAFPSFGDDTFDVGDGGFVDWTRGLVTSEKERLLISGVGLERLAIPRGLTETVTVRRLSVGRSDVGTCLLGRGTMTDSTMLERAREALAGHRWKDAYDEISAAAAERELTGEESEALAEAAWWTAHPDGCIDALERAYAAYSREGNPARAAYVALGLAEHLGDRLQTAQATGWLQRATRLLEGEPECVEHGYLELARARTAGGVEELIRAAVATGDIGKRFGNPDLEAFGLMLQGLAHVMQAEVDRGMAFIDEATVAAVGGELTPFATGAVYCMTIVVCMDLADYRRAGEWTEATARWCERQSINGFPGHCRVRRAEILRLRGGLADAEDEARRAVTELTSFGDQPIAGVGFSEIGAVRLQLGDLDAAEEAFAEARQRGNPAQPGLALLQLARGRSVAARASIRAALADQPIPLARARLLPAQVEIALVTHDVAEAREAAEELREIAASFEAPLWHASAHQALGAVLTYEGDAAGAASELRKAIGHWTEAELPFETAQARRWLAIAHRSGGDEESAVLELEAAHATFERLGATLESERTAQLIGDGTPKAGRRIVRTFMFTDIVGSTSLLETIGDEAWEGVVRWHDEALRSAIESNHGEMVHSTGDGFFATFADATTGATCAVAIQRMLAEHRRDHGFAPQVRIGLHAAVATSIAEDYAGLGVHEAARVGALAEGGEILVTCETVEGEPIPFAVTNERAVPLKGIAQPVRIVSIDWQA